jgi:GH25 family lysozyme M1 (1,4-beta-N-acetylmuramidase)
LTGAAPIRYEIHEVLSIIANIRHNHRMRRWLIVLAALFLLVPTPAAADAGVPGSTGGTAEPDWPALVARGDRFIYLKATEGTTVVNPNLVRQREEAARRGLYSGAYHFARPDAGSGAAQATALVDSGGGWTADGTSLPGALDIEWNPYGAACYGLTPEQLVAWLSDFVETYHAATGRWPVIYTPRTWWTQCTAGLASLGATSPLWATGDLANLPHDWTTYTFWQTADRDYFNGTEAGLAAFAAG